MPGHRCVICGEPYEYDELGEQIECCSIRDDRE